VSAGYLTSNNKNAADMAFTSVLDQKPLHIPFTLELALSA